MAYYGVTSIRASAFSYFIGRGQFPLFFIGAQDYVLYKAVVLAASQRRPRQKKGSRLSDSPTSIAPIYGSKYSLSGFYNN